MRPQALISLVSLAPALAAAYPKAPCEEEDAERGTIDETAIGLSADGAHVAMHSRVTPENLVCGIGRDEVAVREVDTGKTLWTGVHRSQLAVGADAPSLAEAMPAAVVSKYGLAPPRRADMKSLDPSARVSDRLVSGIADGGRFEVFLPGVSDALQEVWIARGKLALVFEVTRGTDRGNVTTQAFVQVPIRPESSKASYEELRKRVRAASDPLAALRLIADEAFRKAGNPFAAYALVYEIRPPLEAATAPEAFLAAKSDATLYLSRMKEDGVQACLGEANDGLSSPMPDTPAVTKLRRAIEYNLRLCKKYEYAAPEYPK